MTMPWCAAGYALSRTVISIRRWWSDIRESLRG